MTLHLTGRLLSLRILKLRRCMRKLNTLTAVNWLTVKPQKWIFYLTAYSYIPVYIYTNSYVWFFLKQDLAATDHTYALLDPCMTKARWFDVLDANSWLQKRLQTKCRLIKRMKVKLQDAQRELLTLRRQLRYRHTYRQRHSQIPT